MADWKKVDDRLFQNPSLITGNPPRHRVHKNVNNISIERKKKVRKLLKITINRNQDYYWSSLEISETKIISTEANYQKKKSKLIYYYYIFKSSYVDSLFLLTVADFYPTKFFDR